MRVFHTDIKPSIRKALEDLKDGKIVLIYDKDGREEETDMVIPSILTKPHHVRALRKDGGGLICTTFTAQDGDRLGLPYLTQVLDTASMEFPILKATKGGDLPYDELSAFSLTVNHRKTYTGITDNDRALTISRFGELIKYLNETEADECRDNECRERLGREFRSPGHVHLLRCTPEILKKREGHTELSTAMVIMAGLTPSATICEMMGDSGKALSKVEAKKYAEDRGLIWLTGQEVKDAWSIYNSQ